MDEEGTLELFKAISDRTRFKIIKFLLDGREKCVCDIIPYTNRKQSTVSIHLSNLDDAGILESRKDGRKVFYRICDKRVFGIFKALGYPESRVLKSECCEGGSK